MTEQTPNDWFDPTETTFGDRLAGAREAAGMTQAALAKRLGVKKKTLDHWEHDQAEPRASSLSMLAGLLNVSLTWLLTGEGDGPSGPDGTELSAQASQLMSELREISSQLTLAAERLGRAESQLANVLRETSDE